MLTTTLFFHLPSLFPALAFSSPFANLSCFFLHFFYISPLFTTHLTIHHPPHHSPPISPFTTHLTIHHPPHHSPPTSPFTTHLTIHHPSHHSPPISPFTTHLTIHHPSHHSPLSPTPTIHHYHPPHHQQEEVEGEVAVPISPQVLLPQEPVFQLQRW